jgi:hypothetical protein
MLKRPREDAREERIGWEIVPDAQDAEEQAAGWYAYLEDTLRFPFLARCRATRASSPLRANDEVEVVDIAPDEHEMFVVARWEERTLAVPLIQLEVLDADGQTWCARSPATRRPACRHEGHHHRPVGRLTVQAAGLPPPPRATISGVTVSMDHLTHSERRGRRSVMPTVGVRFVVAVLAGVASGFLAGIVLSEIVGSIGLLAFGQLVGVRFLPVYLAAACAVLVPVAVAWRRRDPRPPD